MLPPPSATTLPPERAPLVEPDALRLSALLDASPEAIAIVDGSWRYVYTNLAFERMSQTGDDIIGKTLWEAFPYLVGSDFEREMRDVMQRRQSAHIEFGGIRGIYDVQIMPFGDGLAFFSRDISDLRKATEDLRQKEERLRTIVNTEPGCVLVLDREGKVLDVNPVGLQLFEVDDYADLLQRPIMPYIASSDQPGLRALLGRVFDGGSDTVSLEIIGCRGTRRRVEHHAVPLRDGLGAIVGALSITADVTARYEFEAALHQRARQHAVLASLGAVALRNPDIEDLTAKAVEAVSETLRLPRHIALDLLRRHGIAGATLAPRVGEQPSSEPQLAAEDSDFVRSMTQLVTAATERRRAEVTLHEREEQLRQSQKMEAIGQLAGGVAHDFNNLLTVINVHTDLLLQQLSDPHAMRGDVEEIARAAARAAALTRQLLTFSRKQVVQPEVLDLGRVVTGVEPMLRRLIGEDVEFETRILAPVRAVLADEGEIEQVLVNLVVNARDAMPQGGRLRVELENIIADDELCTRHPSLRAGDYVQLTVSDTGVGMTSETMARAFEPFFTTKEPGRGTGLGLSTVYGIVKQTGGTITVESEPGAGTIFCVYLPVASEMVTRTSGSTERRVPSIVDETVLLVEDEDSVRRLAKRVLEAQGYTVLEAINGQDALRIAADYGGVIDLLLSDVVMPELGGRLLAERLIATRPDIDVLFISGYTDDEILRRGLLERGQHLLQKPFTATALAHEVRSLLDTKRGRRSAAHAVRVDE